jgi:hypothetical protein
MKYLYEKVSAKVEEMIRKSPMQEIDMETLKRNLPNKVRLTRRDVIDVVNELQKDGVLSSEWRKDHNYNYKKKIIFMKKGSE